MIKEWSDEAWEEFLEQVKKDRNFLKRIEKILKDIERNGYIGIGKPEPLKYGFSGYWSRRIDSYNRIVYKIESGFYKDKYSKEEADDLLSSNRDKVVLMTARLKQLCDIINSFQREVNELEKEIY